MRLSKRLIIGLFSSLLSFSLHASTATQQKQRAQLFETISRSNWGLAQLTEHFLPGYAPNLGYREVYIYPYLACPSSYQQIPLQQALQELKHNIEQASDLLSQLVQSNPSLTSDPQFYLGELDLVQDFNPGRTLEKMKALAYGLQATDAVKRNADICHPDFLTAENRPGFAPSLDPILGMQQSLLKNKPLALSLFNKTFDASRSSEHLPVTVYESFLWTAWIIEMRTLYHTLHDFLAEAKLIDALTMPKSLRLPKELALKVNPNLIDSYFVGFLPKEKVSSSALTPGYQSKFYNQIYFRPCSSNETEADYCFADYSFAERFLSREFAVGRFKAKTDKTVGDYYVFIKDLALDFLFEQLHLTNFLLSPDQKVKPPQEAYEARKSDRLIDISLYKFEYRKFYERINLLDYKLKLVEEQILKLLEEQSSANKLEDILPLEFQNKFIVSFLAKEFQKKAPELLAYLNPELLRQTTFSDFLLRTRVSLGAEGSQIKTSVLRFLASQVLGEWWFWVTKQLISHSQDGKAEINFLDRLDTNEPLRLTANTLSPLYSSLVSASLSYFLHAYTTYILSKSIEKSFEGENKKIMGQNLEAFQTVILASWKKLSSTLEFKTKWIKEIRDDREGVDTYHEFHNWLFNIVYHSNTHAAWSKTETQLSEMGAKNISDAFMKQADLFSKEQADLFHAKSRLIDFMNHPELQAVEPGIYSAEIPLPFQIDAHGKKIADIDEYRERTYPFSEPSPNISPSKQKPQPAKVGDFNFLAYPIYRKFEENQSKVAQAISAQLAVDNPNYSKKDLVDEGLRRTYQVFSSASVTEAPTSYLAHYVSEELLKDQFKSSNGYPDENRILHWTTYQEAISKLIRFLESSDGKKLIESKLKKEYQTLKSIVSQLIYFKWSELPEEKVAVALKEQLQRFRTSEDFASLNHLNQFELLETTSFTQEVLKAVDLVRKIRKTEIVLKKEFSQYEWPSFESSSYHLQFTTLKKFLEGRNLSLSAVIKQDLKKLLAFYLTEHLTQKDANQDLLLQLEPNLFYRQDISTSLQLNLFQPFLNQDKLAPLTSAFTKEAQRIFLEAGKLSDRSKATLLSRAMTQAMPELEKLVEGSSELVQRLTQAFLSSLDRRTSPTLPIDILEASYRRFSNLALGSFIPKLESRHVLVQIDQNVFQSFSYPFSALEKKRIQLIRLATDFSTYLKSNPYQGIKEARERIISLEDEFNKNPNNQALKDRLNQAIHSYESYKQITSQFAEIHKATYALAYGKEHFQFRNAWHERDLRRQWSYPYGIFQIQKQLSVVATDLGQSYVDQQFRHTLKDLNQDSLPLTVDQFTSDLSKLLNTQKSHRDLQPTGLIHYLESLKAYCAAGTDTGSVEFKNKFSENYDITRKALFTATPSPDFSKLGLALSNVPYTSAYMQSEFLSDVSSHHENQEHLAYLRKLLSDISAVPALEVSEKFAPTANDFCKLVNSKADELLIQLRPGLLVPQLSQLSPKLLQGAWDLVETATLIFFHPENDFGPYYADSKTVFVSEIPVAHDSRFQQAHLVGAESLAYPKIANFDGFEPEYRDSYFPLSYLTKKRLEALGVLNPKLNMEGVTKLLKQTNFLSEAIIEDFNAYLAPFLECYDKNSSHSDSEDKRFKCVNETTHSQFRKLDKLLHGRFTAVLQAPQTTLFKTKENDFIFKPFLNETLKSKEQIHSFLRTLFIFWKQLRDEYLVATYGSVDGKVSKETLLYVQAYLSDVINRAAFHFSDRYWENGKWQHLPSPQSVLSAKALLGWNGLVQSFGKIDPKEAKILPLLSSTMNQLNARFRAIDEFIHFYEDRYGQYQVVEVETDFLPLKQLKFYPARIQDDFIHVSKNPLTFNQKDAEVFFYLSYFYRDPADEATFLIEKKNYQDQSNCEKAVTAQTGYRYGNSVNLSLKWELEPGKPLQNVRELEHFWGYLSTLDVYKQKLQDIAASAPKELKRESGHLWTVKELKSKSLAELVSLKERYVNLLKQLDRFSTYDTAPDTYAYFIFGLNKAVSDAVPIRLAFSKETPSQHTLSYSDRAYLIKIAVQTMGLDLRDLDAWKTFAASTGDESKKTVNRKETSINADPYGWFDYVHYKYLSLTGEGQSFYTTRFDACRVDSDTLYRPIPVVDPKAFSTLVQNPELDDDAYLKQMKRFRLDEPYQLFTDRGTVPYSKQQNLTPFHNLYRSLDLLHVSYNDIKDGNFRTDYSYLKANSPQKFAFKPLTIAFTALEVSDLQQVASEAFPQIQPKRFQVYFNEPGTSQLSRLATLHNVYAEVRKQLSLYIQKYSFEEQGYLAKQHDKTRLDPFWIQFLAKDVRKEITAWVHQVEAHFQELSPVCRTWVAAHPFESRIQSLTHYLDVIYLADRHLSQLVHQALFASSSSQEEKETVEALLSSFNKYYVNKAKVALIRQTNQKVTSNISEEIKKLLALKDLAKINNKKDAESQEERLQPLATYTHLINQVFNQQSDYLKVNGRLPQEALDAQAALAAIRSKIQDFTFGRDYNYWSPHISSGIFAVQLAVLAASARYKSVAAFAARWQLGDISLALLGSSFMTDMILDINHDFSYMPQLHESMERTRETRSALTGEEGDPVLLDLMGVALIDQFGRTTVNQQHSEMKWFSRALFVPLYVGALRSGMNLGGKITYWATGLTYFSAEAQALRILSKYQHLLSSSAPKDSATQVLNANSLESLRENASLKILEALEARVANGEVQLNAATAEAIRKDLQMLRYHLSKAQGLQNDPAAGYQPYPGSVIDAEKLRSIQNNVIPELRFLYDLEQKLLVTQGRLKQEELLEYLASSIRIPRGPFSRNGHTLLRFFNLDFLARRPGLIQLQKAHEVMEGFGILSLAHQPELLLTLAHLSSGNLNQNMTLAEAVTGKSTRAYMKGPRELRELNAEIEQDLERLLERTLSRLDRKGSEGAELALNLRRDFYEMANGSIESIEQQLLNSAIQRNHHLAHLNLLERGCLKDISQKMASLVKEKGLEAGQVDTYWKLFMESKGLKLNESAQRFTGDYAFLVEWAERTGKPIERFLTIPAHKHMTKEQVIRDMLKKDVPPHIQNDEVLRRMADLLKDKLKEMKWTPNVELVEALAKKDYARVAGELLPPRFFTGRGEIR